MSEKMMTVVSQLTEKSKRQEEENERLRGLLRQCVPYIEAYDPWDRELFDEIVKEVGDE